MRQSTIFTVLGVILSVLAVPVPSNESQSLEIQTFTGRGTWFNDGLGACGYVNKDSDSIVALSPPTYGAASGPGHYCGQWVKVTNTANRMTAYGMVRDKCPGCGPDDLDMSIGLFEKLGNLNTGVLPISWKFMPENWSP